MGARELRQNPTSVLKDVEGGESYVVTVQSRPVAHLVPVPTAHRWVPGRQVTLNRRTYSDTEFWATVEAARREPAEPRDPWSAEK